MRRTSANRSEQEAAILKAADEEIALVGVGRLSMDVIARQAGVRRSTLYRRYPDRESLITERGRQTFDFAMARLQTVSVDAGPQETAVAAFREGVKPSGHKRVSRRCPDLWDPWRRRHATGASH